MKRYISLVLACGLVTAATSAAAAAQAGADHPAAPPPAAVLSVGQIARQDVAAQPGSEGDTLVEPDVAVSPLDSRMAVAAAHDGRFPDGGAVAITHAWTRDGGRTWKHAAVPGLTTATGGTYGRSSDPVLAFGPDGSAYLSTLLFNIDNCDNAVAVSRSADGGATFGPPILAIRSTSCAYGLDKNWLVVDTSPASPHRGRVYQFWTAFYANSAGDLTGIPQELRWSDDQGRHWSDTVSVSGRHSFSQDSQPMIQPDGTITDAYERFASAGGGEASLEQTRPGRSPVLRRAAAVATGDQFVARTSHDFGATWSALVTITRDVGPGPAGIRCCLPSATADPRTGRLYAAWDSVSPGLVRLSISTDGVHWSAPVRVNRDPGPGYDHVNVDVAAYADRVLVSYGTRNPGVAGGNLVQQQVSLSSDAGRTFAAPISVAAPSDLRYAAQARGIFPGDYMGTAFGAGRIYAVWCRSSRPADPSARFHQTLFAAVLRP